MFACHGRGTEVLKVPRDRLTMSEADDHQRLLQTLESHGQQFLNLFGRPPKHLRSKRKPEESDDSSTSGEEYEEWHGFRTGDADPDDSGDGGSIDSFRGALHCLHLIAEVFMSEGDSEGEFSDEGAVPTGGPSVITFQDPSKKSEAAASDRTLKKAFMVRAPYDVHICLAQKLSLQVIQSFQTTTRKYGCNGEIKTRWG